MEADTVEARVGVAVLEPSHGGTRCVVKSGDAGFR